MSKGARNSATCGGKEGSMRTKAGNYDGGRRSECEEGGGGEGLSEREGLERGEGKVFLRRRRN